MLLQKICLVWVKPLCKRKTKIKEKIAKTKVKEKLTKNKILLKIYKQTIAQIEMNKLNKVSKSQKISSN